MFGVVLAIGLLVDDAIVVVENVERVMHDEGLPPIEAARRSMDQISGALVGIALVLSAVFVPMSFFGGSTGVIYRQFSITMVSSMALSVVVAMVLTPALCATILKPPHAHNPGRRGSFGWFNRTFDRTSRGYESVVQRLTRRTVPAMVVYVVLVASTAALFARTPTAFLPDEDQGVLYSLAQLPAGATQQETIEVLKRIEQHFLGNEKEAIESLFTVAGFSFAGRGQNMGIAFVNLRPWDERTSDALKVDAVARRAMGAFAQIREAMVFAFAPPAVTELANAAGLHLHLQDRAALGHERLMSARNHCSAWPRRLHPAGLHRTGRGHAAVPTGREHGARRGGEPDGRGDQRDGFEPSGSAYVNDFIDRGRVKRVYLQADAPFRMLPGDPEKWDARNGDAHGAVRVLCDRAVESRVAAPRTLQRRAVRRVAGCAGAWPQLG